MEAHAGSDNAPTAAAARRGSGIQWLIDSGSCFDLVNRQDLTEPMAKRVRQAEAIPLATANGGVEASDRIQVTGWRLAAG